MRPHRLAVVTLVAVLLAWASGAYAQARDASEDGREQAFVDSLRREDPATAERYVTLRDARTQALNDMRRAEAQYSNAGPLQAVFVNAVRQARRKYAETSLALLEFFDARDKESVVRYREEIEKITRLIEERQRTRADLQKMLAP